MAHWYTADTHFGHENVMTFYDRPFASIEEMDTTLRAHMKDRVGQDEADLEIALGHNRATCRASGWCSQASQYVLPLSQ
jgi:calcineurin-like phosphoesterase family protein